MRVFAGPEEMKTGGCCFGVAVATASIVDFGKKRKRRRGRLVKEEKAEGRASFARQRIATRHYDAGNNGVPLGIGRCALNRAYEILEEKRTRQD